MKVNFGKYPSSRSKKERVVSIKIDPWDTWSADWTIAAVAYPLLVQLKETKHGAPYVDDEDVPEGLNLRSTEAEPKENEYDVDSNHFKRWDWVMDEMIYAMKEISEGKPTSDSFYDYSECRDDDGVIQQITKIKLDREGLEKYETRVNNGCVLFGKYFQSLWD